ncbi:MAG: 30S ribosomal protein S17 [Candidatus Shapirobacteria bacterium]|jgi:small subunit ribosomal protein S17
MEATNKPVKTGKTFIGTVVSTKMANTITVSLNYKFKHPLYQKIVKKTNKIYASNNLNAKVGDRVQVVETRPLSKLKRFTTQEIITKK